MIKYRLKKGFTLVEIALVLSIAAIAGFVAFSQIVRGQELMKAQFAGSQIKQLGEAVNAYISNHYDTLFCFYFGASAPVYLLLVSLHLHFKFFFFF